MKKYIITIISTTTIFTQVTISIDDLQYEIGGYYEMYNIPSPQGIVGLTGIIGGPYIFDFSDGPTTASLMIDYVDVNDGGHGADFPYASIAERKSNGESNSWLYMDFQSGVGRTIHGFYDAIGAPESPSIPFNPSMIDFPDDLDYLDYFTGNTNFSVVSSGIDLDVAYEFSGFVDAFGSVILPGDLGEYECLQINYEEQFTFYYLGTPIGYTYIRSYYYLAEDLGIAVIISSLEDENPVPNTFNIARTFARLYVTSKEVNTGLLGDINNDGVINVLDVVITVNIILGVIEPTEDEAWAADVNQDGNINVLDIVLIVNIILGE